MKKYAYFRALNVHWASIGKGISENGQKRVAIFSGRCAGTTCIPPPPVTPLAKHTLCYKYNVLLAYVGLRVVKL